MQNAVSVFVCTGKSVKDPRQGECRAEAGAARAARRNMDQALAPTRLERDASGRD